QQQQGGQQHGRLDGHRACFRSSVRRDFLAHHWVRTTVEADKVVGKAKLARVMGGVKLCVAVTVTDTRTRESLSAVHRFAPPAAGQLTAVASLQLQAVDTLGVTGEQDVPESVRPRKLHTSCSAAVVGSVTFGSFQFALMYSAPARVAPRSEAQLFINNP